jgi:hypothetical protein
MSIVSKINRTGWKQKGMNEVRIGRELSALEAELERLKKLRGKFRKKEQLLLKDADYKNGSLVVYKRKSGDYFARKRMDMGEVKVEYLGKEETRTVMVMKEKRFLESALRQLDKNIKHIEEFAGNYKPFDPYAINKELKSGYRMSEDRIKEIVGLDEAEKWKASALKQKARIEELIGIPFPEERNKTCKDGTKVRSKSETIIANALINAGLQFVYELPVDINAGLEGLLKDASPEAQPGVRTWRPFYFRPDFTVFSPRRNRPVLWEHFGMMQNEKYREGHAYKIDAYMKAGFVPGLDVVMTYDDMDGAVSSDAVERIINESFLTGA